MKRTLLNTLAFLPLALAAQRLEVIGSGGFQVARGGVSITSTIGEVCVAAQTGSKSFATEGFQQGFLMPSTTVERSEKVESAPNFTLFPNPAVDRMQVNLQNMGEQAIWLRLYDNLGKLVQETQTSAGSHTFDVSTLSAGKYWIAVQPAENAPTLTLPFVKINR